MKFQIKLLIWVFFLVLLFSNVFIFISSIKLSNNLSRYEKNIMKLHRENLNLENDVYRVDSLQHAASIAQEMDFTKKSDIIYLEDLKYAKNQ